MPLPPEIIVLAEVSSGRSDFVNSSPINSEIDGIFSAVILTTSHSAESVVAALKAVGLTVRTFLASVV